MLYYPPQTLLNTYSSTPCFEAAAADTAPCSLGSLVAPARSLMSRKFCESPLLIRAALRQAACWWLCALTHRPEIGRPFHHPPACSRQSCSYHCLAAAVAARARTASDPSLCGAVCQRHSGCLAMRFRSRHSKSLRVPAYSGKPLDELLAAAATAAALFPHSPGQTCQYRESGRRLLRGPSRLPSIGLWQRRWLATPTHPRRILQQHATGPPARQQTQHGARLTPKRSYNQRRTSFATSARVSWLHSESAESRAAMAAHLVAGMRGP